MAEERKMINLLSVPIITAALFFITFLKFDRIFPDISFTVAGFFGVVAALFVVRIFQKGPDLNKLEIYGYYILYTVIIALLLKILNPIFNWNPFYTSFLSLTKLTIAFHAFLILVIVVGWFTVVITKNVLNSDS